MQQAVQWVHSIEGVIQKIQIDNVHGASVESLLLTKSNHLRE